MFEATSYFTIGGSLLSPKDCVLIAKEYGYPSVALVDLMSITGMVEFFKAAKEVDIKPVLGCKLRVYLESTEFYVNVFVRNKDGFHELMDLLTLANRPEYFYKHSRLPLSAVSEASNSNNLIFSTCFEESIFKTKATKEILDEITFKAIQLVTNLSPLHSTYNYYASQLASPEYLRTTYTVHPTFYKSADHADSLDISNAIQRRAKKSDPWFRRRYVREYFPKRCSEIDRSNDWGNIPDQCDYVWEPLEVSLPQMAEDESAMIRDLIDVGWNERVENSFMGFPARGQTEKAKYKKRLDMELGVLEDMGFVRYFLLVADLVNWAKNQGIRVGPGRGSVGASLIAFLMGITDVDPIRFDLIFERFINPERLDLPDADLDFMSSRRQEVIQYLIDTYGAERTSGITNYVMSGPSSAIRDAGRTIGLDQMDLLPSKVITINEDLDDALKNHAEIEQFKNDFPEVWEVAYNLEGVLRNYGKHAGGFVVTDDLITNHCVLENRKGELICNWDKKLAELFGLVKLDLLGLSMLDVIDNCLKSHPDVNLYDIPLDDPRVLSAFSEADTVGVFQAESSGMKKVLKNLGASGEITFDALSATIALYRPGPMESGLLDDYVAVAQGCKAVFYEHPSMERALKDTNGVIVYQESVMQISMDLCGFSMAEADHLRKAMGKKDAELMAEQKDKFVSGAISHSGVEESMATELFDKIQKFAGYAFNKSHSVAYSIISYWSMYFKVYYPAAFYAAALNIESDEASIKKLVRDAKNHGIAVLPPDINISTDKYEARGDNIYASIVAMKGFSEKTYKAVSDARELVKERLIDMGGETVENPHYNPEGKVDSYEAFEYLVNKTSCNIRRRETMLKVGCFAGLGESGGPPSLDESRIKDQLELLPGVILSNIRAERVMVYDSDAKLALSDIYKNCLLCQKCDLQELPHPKPFVGSERLKVMVVLQCPNGFETNQIMQGMKRSELIQSITGAGLSTADIYMTTQVKAKKNRKMLTNEQINGCKEYLDAEVELFKPSVIVACGSSTVRHFIPDLKGGIEDLNGDTFYLKDLDATLVASIAPGMIYHDPNKQTMLDDVFDVAAEIVEEL